MRLDASLIDWLLSGDVSIQYQVQRDLLNHEDNRLRQRIAKEGWGRSLLEKRRPDGHWGQKYYQPKWISTHYTVLDLKNLGISQNNASVLELIASVADTLKGADGGILPIGAKQACDICVNGMFVNFACYFGIEEEKLESIVDFLLDERMGDGGFNCNSNTIGAMHSSLHSTISCVEGIDEYVANGYHYRVDELQAAAASSREFMLQHQLFRSDHTGETIDKKMLMLSYPSRWRYDVLRGLDYFRKVGADYDSRMDDAIDVLKQKMRTDGTWPVQAKHAGQVHFDMEQTGKPSRWNTLRALRVLEHFGQA